MTTAVETGVAAAARWRLLSLGFTAPTEEIVRELEALAESLLERGDAAELGELLEALRGAGSDALAAQYHALFGGPVRISPYEGGHELDPVRQGREMADVAGFYRAFGAEAHGPAAERPDHVGCELEFLAYLELNRLAAAEEGDEDAAARMDEVASEFLRDHAGRWLPAFFADARAAAVDKPVYHVLADIGAQFLRDDLERRGGVEPLPAGRGGRHRAVERDSFACG